MLIYIDKLFVFSKCCSSCVIAWWFSGCEWRRTGFGTSHWIGPGVALWHSTAPSMVSLLLIQAAFHLRYPKEQFASPQFLLSNSHIDYIWCHCLVSFAIWRTVEMRMHAVQRGWQPPAKHLGRCPTACKRAWVDHLRSKRRTWLFVIDR